jgi:gluconokinase
MATNTSPLSPSLYIIMGVSGCGKSTVATLLANKLGCKVIEADDYHSSAAKSLMSKGVGLTEKQRAPWIDKLCLAVKAELSSSSYVVMSYSGLKKHHREKFRQLGIKSYFFNLELPYNIIFTRLTKRIDHFIDESLLLSQFNDFEMTENEPDTHLINGDNSPEQLVNEIDHILSST